MAAGCRLPALLVLTLVATLAAGCSASTTPSPPAAADPSAAGAATIAGLHQALSRGDRSAAAALADAELPGVGVRLGMVATNAALLDLDVLRVRVRRTGPVDHGEWSGRVEVGWRLPHGDRGVSTVSVPVAFRWDGGRAVITGFGDGAGRMPLWLARPLALDSGPGWQVVSVAGESSARVVTATRIARRAVTDVLGPQRPVVVEVPAAGQEYDAALGARPGEFAAFAAVTTTADGSTRSRVAPRIVVNPDRLADMRALGLAVVLAHEAVHVAAGDVTSPAPRWFTEGFADLVALRGLGLRGRTDASNAELRRVGLPTRLPDRRSFEATGTALEAAYERSRVACEVIAARVGLDDLVRLSTLVTSGGRRFGQALREITGMTLRDLERAWRLRLVRSSR